MSPPIPFQILLQPRVRRMPSTISPSVEKLSVTTSSLPGSVITNWYSPRVQVKTSSRISRTWCSIEPIRSSGSIAPSSIRMVPSRRPGAISLLASRYWRTVILPRTSRSSPRRSSGSVLRA